MSGRTGLHHIAFYPSDWLAGTRGLSAIETGVYITIIAMLYERGEPLDMDDGRVARLCGTTPKTFTKAVDFLVSEGKLQRLENGLWNARVEKELKKAREKSDVASEKAKKRWEKTVENQSPDDAGALPQESRGNASARVNQNQNQTLGGGGGYAGAREGPPDPDDLTFRERLLEACRVDRESGLTGRGGSRLGDRPQMVEAQRWTLPVEKGGLGLSEDEIVAHVAEVVAGKRDGPPSTLTYFRGSLERLAGQLAEAQSLKLKPAQGAPPSGAIPQNRPFRVIPNIPPEFQNES